MLPIKVGKNRIKNYGYKGKWWRNAIFSIFQIALTKNL